MDKFQTKAGTATVGNIGKLDEQIHIFDNAHMSYSATLGIPLVSSVSGGFALGLARG